MQFIKTNLVYILHNKLNTTINLINAIPIPKLFKNTKILHVLIYIDNRKPPLSCSRQYGKYGRR